MGNLKRSLNNLKFGSIATFASAGMTILNLIFGIAIVVVAAINQTLDSSIYLDCLSYFINALFYFWITRQFMMSKSNYYFAFNGICALLICDYIIPAVFSVFYGVVGGIATGNPFYFYSTILVTVLSLGVGIAYFICCFLDVRKGGTKKGLEIAMIVLGAILFAFALYVFVITTINYVSTLVTYGSELGIYNIVVYVVEIISSFFTFLMSSLYLLYILFLRRIRTRGY